MGMSVPDEVRNGRAHPALNIDLGHLEAVVYEAFHERPVELEQLISPLAVHRQCYETIRSVSMPFG